MRPVILSSPEKLAFLLTIFCAGGSETTSSPGCSVAGVCGTPAPPLGWRCPGSGAAPGGASTRTRLRRRDGNARLGILRNDGGAGRRRQRLRLHRSRRRHALPRRRTIGRRQQAAPRQFRHLLVVVVDRRLLLLPRGIAPGGRGAGSEKILPICARAGGASEIVEAATRAAIPVRAMVRNISRLQKANRARDIVQTYPPLAGYTG